MPPAPSPDGAFSCAVESSYERMAIFRAWYSTAPKSLGNRGDPSGSVPAVVSAPQVGERLARQALTFPDPTRKLTSTIRQNSPVGVHRSLQSSAAGNRTGWMRRPMRMPGRERG